MIYLLKNKNNDTFSSKLILQYGVHLGGSYSLLQIDTSSVVFGIRSSNVIIDLSLTSIELINTLNIIKGLGFRRAVLYFINSIINFKLAFKSSFFRFNKHLFFPIYLDIHNVLRKLRAFSIKRKLKKIEKKNGSIFFKRKFFLLKSGKSLLRKIFISSKWSYGFVSNAVTFFKFTDNVLHEKVMFGKDISVFKNKVESFVDFYPFLPHYGIIGDHRKNYWIVNEFRMARVPNSSVIDTFSTRALLSMYGIPGNACSVDASLFFLSLSVSNYLLGYFQQVIKFTLKKQSKKNKNVFLKHSFFFKKFKNIYFNFKHELVS